jgi:hypothetical protein
MSQMLKNVSRKNAAKVINAVKNESVKPIIQKLGVIRGEEAQNICLNGVATSDNGPVFQMLDWNTFQQPDVYQRKLSNSHVKAIVDNFNPKALGCFHVAKRKGTNLLYLMDGQHRWIALHNLVANGVQVPTLVRCFVYEYTDQKEEAQLFELFNNAKATTDSVRFNAGLYSKNPEVLSILNDVRSEGFDLKFGSGRIGNGKNNYITGGTANLREIHNNYPGLLGPVMQLLRMAKGNNNASDVPKEIKNTQFLKSMAIFLDNQPNKDNIPSIATRLKHVDLVQAWLDGKRAPSGYDRTKETAKTIEQQYAAVKHLAK